MTKQSSRCKPQWKVLVFYAKTLEFQKHDRIGCVENVIYLTK
jgi:hypothetical protein